MKKIISAVTGLALALSLTVASVSAAPEPTTVNFEGLTYTIGENNKMAYRVGRTDAHTSQGYVDMVDVISNYKTSTEDPDYWISTSYNDGGFKIEHFTEGLTVTPSAKSILNGNYMQVSFTAKADTAVENGKLGIFYDVEINSNDDAQLNVIKSGNKVIGFDMTDDNGQINPKLSVFLRGKTGVTDVDQYWFGDFRDGLSNTEHSMETEPIETFNSSLSGPHYLKDDNGNLIGYKNSDSAMTFGWNNINLAAGEEKTFSIIIGVGNANSDAPVISSVDKTDAGYVVKGTQTGDYEKQNFAVMYKVASEESKTSTSPITWDGDNFTTTIPVDVSAYTTAGDYNISFVAMNNYGATSNEVSKTFTVAAAPVEIEEPETPLAPEVNPKTNADAISIASIAGLITICGGVALITRRKKASK